MRAGIVFSVITLLGLAVVSCNQDDIFSKIASETAPREPRIKGAPTNIVVFEREIPDRDDPVPIMYVASGRLHWYAKATDSDTSKWDLKEYTLPQPKGNVIALAVTKEQAPHRQRLYALCRNSNSINATVQYIESNGSEWQTVSLGATDYPVIQSIYADPASNRLFAGASKNSLATYGILYLDTTSTSLKLLKGDTSIFSGAVYRESEDIHYLSTRGGIFQISDADLAQNKIDSLETLIENTAVEEKDKKNDRMFMGMIKLEDNTIIAIERNGGALHEIQMGSFTRMQNADGKWIKIDKYATGAMTLWENLERNNLKKLVVGIQGGLFSTTTSSHTYGYVEFDLTDAAGVFDKNLTRHDAGKLQTVDDNDRYTANMGTLPINHLFQTPENIDSNRTFFASTQTVGLWSYRDRPKNGGWQWNAEE